MATVDESAGPQEENELRYLASAFWNASSTAYSMQTKAMILSGHLWERR